jgi:hypothetical protein
VTKTKTFLLPVDGTDAVELANTGSNVLYRKQILPRGKIKYQGQELDLNDQLFQEIQTAFNDGALDQVPLQLADSDNKHTMAPERFGGEVKGLELTADGLDAIVSVPKDTHDLIQKTGKKLGVSVKVTRNRELPNGKTYPSALIHVLGTLDPKITQMGAWQELAAANEDSEEDVIDFTAFSYGVPNKTPEQQKPPVQTGDDELGPDDLALANEIAELLAAASKESGKEDDMEFTNTDAFRKAVAAATRADRDRTRALEIELANSRFETEAHQLIEDGVPTAMVELARPVLSNPSNQDIELANGDKVDVSAVLRSMLQQAKGYLELANERGTSIDFGHEVTDEAILASWDPEH